MAANPETRSSPASTNGANRTPARDPIAIPALRVGHSHTGEEVLATAQGPGADQVRGFLPNTQLFQIMMNAYGWKK